MFQEYGTAYLNHENPSPEGRNPYPPIATYMSAYLLQGMHSSTFQHVILFFMLVVTGLSYLLHKQNFDLRLDIVCLCCLITLQLLSYGSIFEIERGQFNFIAYSLSLGAIFLLDSDSQALVNSRLSLKAITAIVLGSLSVHLKAFPIFLLAPFFLGYILREGVSFRNKFGWTLLIVNVLLLLFPGRGTLRGFLDGVKAHQEHPFLWNGNHSIMSFLNHVSISFNLTPLALILWLIATVYCAVIVKVRAVPLTMLLLPFYILSCLLPAVSHDYKLSFMVPAAFVFIRNLPLTRKELLTYTILLVIVLLPFSNVFLDIKTPALLFILLLSLNSIRKSLAGKGMLFWLNRLNSQKASI